VASASINVQGFYPSGIEDNVLYAKTSGRQHCDPKKGGEFFNVREVAQAFARMIIDKAIPSDACSAMNWSFLCFSPSCSSNVRLSLCCRN